MASLKNTGNATDTALRTEKDLSLKVVGWGSLALVALISLLPQIPGEGIAQRTCVISPCGVSVKTTVL